MPYSTKWLPYSAQFNQEYCESDLMWRQNKMNIMTKPEDGIALIT